MKSPLGRIEGNFQPHYQDKLGDLIRTFKPEIVVETGVWEGLGSEYILKALDDNGSGVLYSIDPMDPEHLSNGMETEAVGGARSLYEDHPIIHPRFTLIRAMSQDALRPLLDKTGPWDMFVHDSDHGEACQTFEYEFAWEAVRPGGIIVTDDPFWGIPCHWAWNRFLERHNIAGATVMGGAQYFVKP